MKEERWYHHPIEELRFDAEAGVVEGTVVRYGDVAIVPIKDKRGAIIGLLDEQIRAGAFSITDETDVTLNYGHNRQRVFARTGGGGLELDDTGAALTMRLRPAADNRGQGLRGPTWRTARCAVSRSR